MDNQNIGSQMPGQSISPVEPPTKGKRLTIGLVIAIVVLLGAVVYLLSSRPSGIRTLSNDNQIKNQEKKVDTQSLTADWQTYANAEYGFELQLSYPWKGYKVFSSEGSQGVGHPTYLQFSMPTLDKTKCVQSVADEVCGYAQIFEITIYDKNIWDQMSADQKKWGQILGQNSDFVYIYGVRPVELPNDLRDTNFDISRSISTFKFNTPGEITNWKTYRNEEYGFEFQYPADWYVIFSGSEQVDISNMNISTINQAPAEGQIVIAIETKSMIGLYPDNVTDFNSYLNWWANEEDVICVGECQPIQYAKTKIGLLDAYKAVYLDNNLTVYAINMGNPRGEFIFISYNQITENKTANKIISTFKFTN